MKLEVSKKVKSTIEVGRLAKREGFILDGMPYVIASTPLEVKRIGNDTDTVYVFDLASCDLLCFPAHVQVTPSNLQVTYTE